MNVSLTTPTAIPTAHTLDLTSATGLSAWTG
jgi:hypothetical protein